MQCPSLSSSLVWYYFMGSYLLIKLDALLALQNKFVKIIHFSDQYDSPRPLFISWNTLKINELHKLQLVSFVYESSLQQNLHEFHNFFSNISNIHSYATRQSSDQEFFILCKNTTQYGLFSVCYAGASLWIDIPKDIRSRPSVHSFRKTLKKHFISLYQNL